MRNSLQFAKTVALASGYCIWQYRAILLVPGLAIVAIDFITLQSGFDAFKPVLHLLSMALLVTVGICMHRTILLGDTRINLGWSMREVRYLLVLIGMLAAGLFVLAVVQYSFLNLLAGFLLPDEYPIPDTLNLAEYDAPVEIQTRLSYLLIISGVVGLAGFSMLFSRLFMLLPMSAADRTLDVTDVWHRSKKNQFSMFWLIFLPVVSFLPLGIFLRVPVLAPFVLIVVFVIQIFIFCSFSVAYHISETETDH